MDIFTLGNEVFVEVLKFVFIGGCMVGAVILGKFLRDRHDAKVVAAEAEEKEV